MKLSLCFNGYVTAKVDTVIESETGNSIKVTKKNKDQIEDGLYDGTYIINSLAEMIDEGDTSFDLHDFVFID